VQREGHGGDGGIAGAAKKVGGLLFGGRGRLTGAAHRRKVIELIGEANDAGAGLVSACREIDDAPGLEVSLGKLLLLRRSLRLRASPYPVQHQQVIALAVCSPAQAPTPSEKPYG
jgi:hypothetical protein